MTGPLDPLSWDDMLDDLGYSSEDDDDTLYYKATKTKKSNKRTKFRDYEWDEYD